MSAIQTATDFLKWMFGGKMGSNYVLIWRLEGKISSFHRKIEAAAKNVNDGDVYFGCGLASKSLKGGRGKISNVGAITSVWLDVDYRSSAHKKKNIPPDEEAAMKLIGDMPFDPSVVIHSGHGLQAYWRLNEPWILESKEDRQKAGSVTKGWCDLAREFAKRRKWDVDAVGDLARVMRLPGSVNCKIKNHEVEVRILSGPGNEYDREDLIDVLGSRVDTTQTAVKAAKKAGIVFSASANPPTEKFLVLCENNRKFKQTWKRNRKDMQDQSPSAYDMSLAVIACQANWSDQEVIDLLIAGRRTHGNDLKQDRPDYYLEYTLPKARSAVRDDIERASTIEVLEHEAEKAMNGGGEKEKKDSREIVLENIKKILKLPICRWIQRGREPRTAQFSMILEDGRELLIGKAESTLQQAKFQAAIYVGCQKVLPTLKAKDWKQVCQSLAAIVEIEEIEELDRDQQIREWLRMYCSSYGLNGEAEGSEYIEAFEHGQPFIKDGELHVMVRGLQKFIKVTLLEPVTSADMYSQLSMIGYRRKTVSAKLPSGKVTSRSYYVGLSNGILPKKAVEEQEDHLPI